MVPELANPTIVMARLVQDKPAMTWRVLVFCLTLVTSSSAAAADPPRRVVSFNICADQLVVALADPAQIAGLSPYATDPTLSAVAEEARAFRRVPWHAESVVPLDPDLVLVGPRDRSVTQRMLGALGFRVVGIDLVEHHRRGARANSRRSPRCSGSPGAARICWRGSTRRGRGLRACRGRPPPPRSWSVTAATRRVRRASPPR